MSLPRPSLIGLMALLALEAAAAPPVQRGFEAYPRVGSRNIFNPDRQMDAASAAAPGPAAAAPAANADVAALTGTMLTAEKSLAFFSGSRPEWGGVFGVGTSIAGARITKISRGGIEVERDGKTIAIAVGQCVPMDGSSVPAPAPLLPGTAVPPSAPPAPQPGPASSPNPAASAVPASPDREALIRRMMEKRQQELK